MKIRVYQGRSLEKESCWERHLHTYLKTTQIITKQAVKIRHSNREGKTRVSSCSDFTGLICHRLHIPFNKRLGMSLPWFACIQRFFQKFSSHFNDPTPPLIGQSRSFRVSPLMFVALQIDCIISCYSWFIGHDRRKFGS